MDNELRLIRYLYGEEEHPEEVERLLAADAPLRAEYSRLKATKNRLDARPRQRPDAVVIDRILAAAAGSDGRAPRAARRDRPSVARTRGPRRRALGLTSALAVLLVAVGVWQWDAGRLLEPAAPESLVEAPSAAESQQATASAASDEEALPAWNEADDELMRLHGYIETLHVRSSPERWDSPASGLLPASQTRPSGR